MNSEPPIDYEALALEAMRGVVRTVLGRVAKSGLPGEHHFYISFRTGAPGVVLSKRLREKYPAEMTIVLQHRFRELTVTDDRFEVRLTFDGIPERVVVPFLAIKFFADPSVRYGLQFERQDESARFPSWEAADLHDDEEERPLPSRSVALRKSRSPRKPQGRSGTDLSGPKAVDPPAVTSVASVEASERQPAEDEASVEAPDDEAKIVRLDTFRRR